MWFASRSVMRESRPGEGGHLICFRQEAAYGCLWLVVLPLNNFLFYSITRLLWSYVPKPVTMGAGVTGRGSSCHGATSCRELRQPAITKRVAWFTIPEKSWEWYVNVLASCCYLFEQFFFVGHFIICIYQILQENISLFDIFDELQGCYLSAKISLV